MSSVKIQMVGTPPLGGWKWLCLTCGTYDTVLSESSLMHSRLRHDKAPVDSPDLIEINNAITSIVRTIRGDSG